LLTVGGRLVGSGAHNGAGLADSIVFVLLNLAQLVILAALVLRDRRLRSTPGGVGTLS
jgi:hypothetical protein